jgi:hypothetical protein
VSRKKKRAPIDPAEIANAAAAGRLAPEDAALALSPRDNGLVVPVVETPKPTPPRSPAPPAPGLVKTYSRKCAHCGVGICGESQEEVEYRIRAHVGAIPDIAARCNQLRRQQGLI